MKYVWTVVIVLAVFVLGAVIFAWSGRYDIAATSPHWGVTRAFLELVRERSVEVQSQGLQAPAGEVSELMQRGVAHYQETCRLCHGAPGYRSEEFAQGLYPQPPGMISGEVQAELSEAGIFWIVAHGLKMTGMPAFGPTHDRKDLWGITVLVKEMPGLSPEQYRKLLRKAGAETEYGHEHSKAEPGFDARQEKS